MIDWDSESNVSRIRQQVALIRKGCGCKTGCSSSRCNCKKRNGYCGPGCKCTGCTNLPVEALAAEQEDIDSASDSASASDEQSDVSSDIDGSHLDVEVNQLMCDIFGDSEGEDL